MQKTPGAPDSRARRAGLLGPALGVVLLALAACVVSAKPPAPCPDCDGAPAPDLVQIGTPVSEADIAAWDIDVRPDGAGLPPGGGTAVEGRRLFEFGPTGLFPRRPDGILDDPARFTTCPGGPSRCALCHGAGGRGGNTGNTPQLVGGRWPDCPPRFPVDPAGGSRTVGSYWPLATTLFDYIRRAMPFDCPGSLTNDEAYAVTAYLLYLNGIVDRDEELNAETLPAINERMPNHPNFFRTPAPYLPKADGGPDHGAPCGTAGDGR